MSNGARKMLPCGHEGVAVVGQFFACTVHGCDGNDRPSIEGKKCPDCSSRNVEDFTVEGIECSWHCWDCGGVW